MSLDKLIKIGPDLKSGDEFKPLRHFNTFFPCHVFVIDNKGDDNHDGGHVVRHGEFDYADRDHRLWLGKLTFWALSEGYSVETVAKKDAEPEWNE